MYELLNDDEFNYVMNYWTNFRNSPFERVIISGNEKKFVWKANMQYQGIRKKYWEEFREKMLQQNHGNKGVVLVESGDVYIHDDPEVAFLHASDIAEKSKEKVVWYHIGEELK
jgi:hypothetical protein